MTNFVVGANKEGYHYINANLSDFNYDLCADIVNVKGQCLGQVVKAVELELVLHIISSQK